MFRRVTLHTYKNQLKKWPLSQQDQAEKLTNRLKEQPYSGKSLGYRFFRELKIKERRIYFLVYDDLQLILLVATSDKKDQTTTISYIKNNLPEFKELARKISRS